MSVSRSWGAAALLAAALAGAARVGPADAATADAAPAGAAPASAAAADAVSADAASAVGALHVGEVLFLQHQGRDFAALTALMVSQQQGRLRSQDPAVDSLRGSLLLSWGQLDEATAVFTSLANAPTGPSGRGGEPEAARDRAWYALALARQQRGQLPQAEAALARMATPLDSTRQAERLLLQSQLLMARDDPAAATAALQAISGDSTAARYGRYNLAVALLQQAQASQPQQPGPREGSSALRQRGLALLDGLGRQEAADEEQRSLRDRANLARGMAALADQQPREARAALQRVRLQGGASNAALLGYGWAAMGLNDPRLALVPWQELAERPADDAAALEARLAGPYALAEIGAFGNALAGYRQAAAAFAAARLAVDDTLAAVQGGRFIDAEIAVPAPHRAQLQPLLASHAFHEGLKNLRELQFLRGHAAQGLDALAAFEDALDQRRRAYAEGLPPVLAQRGAAAIAELQRQRDGLALEIAQADRAADGRAYADTAEQGLIARLQRGRATLAQLAAAGSPAASGTAAAAGAAAVDAVAIDARPVNARSIEARSIDASTIDASTIDASRADTPAIADRLRRAAGALTWRLAQAATARAASARQALRDTDATLAQVRAHEAALTAAQAREPARLAAIAQRVTALRAGLQAIAPQAQALAAEQQQALQALAVAELQQQQARLKVYAAQAQLAIAQVQDAAQFARQAALQAGAGDAAMAPMAPLAPKAAQDPKDAKDAQTGPSAPAGGPR